MSVELEAGEVRWCWVHDQHTLRRLNFKKRVHQHQRMLKERNQLNVDSFIHSLLAAAPFDKIEYGLALKWKGGFIEKENKFEFKWCITYEMENLCWKLLFIYIFYFFPFWWFYSVVRISLLNSSRVFAEKLIVREDFYIFPLMGNFIQWVSHLDGFFIHLKWWNSTNITAETSQN